MLRPVPSSATARLIQARSSFFIDDAVALSYAPCVKVKDVLKLLRDEGWRLARMKGSHRQYVHPTKGGRVTVPDKPNDELAPGTLNSILKQAGLK